MHFKTPARLLWLGCLALLTTLLLVAAPRSAQAQSWSLGVTAYGENDDGPQAELLIDRQFRPFADGRKWAFSPGISARVTANTGYWVGAGVIASRFYGADDGWRFDAGFMPGYYDPGDDGTDLGSDIEFRTYLSLGHRITEGYYLALEVEHMSNAGLDDRNPGDNRLILRLTRLDLK